jgi:hypothetical protein
MLLVVLQLAATKMALTQATLDINIRFLKLKVIISISSSY